MIWIWLLGCGEKQEPPQETEEEQLVVDTGHCEDAPTYEEWALGFFRGKCQACHASQVAERYGAPEAVSFDTYQEIMSWLPSIEHSVLQAGSMPPSGGVTEEEAELLQQWIACQP